MQLARKTPDVHRLNLVELAREEIGARNWPMFSYNPKLESICLAQVESGGITILRSSSQLRANGLITKRQLSPGPIRTHRCTKDIGFGEHDAGKTDKDGVYRIARRGNA